jgi:CO dehydrogenase maturation factor
MAASLGVKHTLVAANKVRSEKDVTYIKQSIGGMEIAGLLSFDDAIMEADMKGTAPYDSNPRLVEEIGRLKGNIEQFIGKSGD